MTGYRLVIYLIPFVLLFSFGMDMYIPQLIVIGKEFQINAEALQWTLNMYLLAFAGGQIVLGQLSDYYGRRRILMLATLGFIIASGLAVIVTHLWQLLILRFIQGFCACGTRISAFAILRDSHKGAEIAKLYSYLAGAIGISPAIAPMLGTVIGAAGWRYNFAFLCLLGVSCLLLCRKFDSSLPLIRQAPKFTIMWQVARHRRLVFFSVLSGVAIAHFFTFISLSSYLIVQTMHLNYWYFNFSFALFGVTMLIISQISGRLAYRFGNIAVIKTGLGLYLTSAVGLMGLALLPQLHFVSFCSITVLGCAGGILMNGPGIAEALRDFDTNVGLAVSITGVVGYVTVTLIGETIVSLDKHNTLAWGAVLSVLIIGLWLGLRKFDK